MADAFHLWWIDDVELVYIFSLFCSFSSQTRWRDAEAHPWRDCPLALLPLACGYVPGWSPHCGPDHLRQELGRQGRGNKKEEAFINRKAADGKKVARRCHVWQLDPLQVCRAPSCTSFHCLIWWWSCFCLRIILGRLPYEMSANRFFCYDSK